MPGPSNNKKKSKPRGKNQKRHSGNLPRAQQYPETISNEHSNQSSAPSSPSVKTPTPIHIDRHPTTKEEVTLGGHVPRTIEQIEQILFQEPFIYDPGNGPRVRSARAFMSSFFAKPPALDDPLCAEFAQEEVLQMLCTVLPEETALILWYNKSRSESRVCPACQRLYRIGDALPDLIDDDSESFPDNHSSPSPKLLQEQKISGLCSPVCFIVASFNRPGAIKAAWGRMGDEMDDDTWDLLSGSGEDAGKNELSNSLGMLVRMTRLHDLGLAQLCFDAEGAALLQAATELDSDLGPDLVP